MDLLVTMISLLSKLEKHWNDEYMLFADNGCLTLAGEKNGLIIETFPRIPCDGGEPDHKYIGADEYIVRED